MSALYNNEMYSTFLHQTGLFSSIKQVQHATCVNNYLHINHDVCHYTVEKRWLSIVAVSTNCSDQLLENTLHTISAMSLYETD